LVILLKISTNALIF